MPLPDTLIALEPTIDPIADEVRKHEAEPIIPGLSALEDELSPVPATPAAASEAPVQETPEAQTPAWDSPENPYRQRVAELEAQITSREASPEEMLLDMTPQMAATQIDLWQKEAVANMKERGVPDEVIPVIITAMQERLAANVQAAQARRHVNQVTGPAADSAKFRVAYDVLQKAGMAEPSNAALSALMKQNSVAAMQAEAKKIAGEKRDQAFKSRGERGLDVVEVAGMPGGSTPANLGTLNPSDIIAAGIRSGDLQRL